jgi:hypothetical protein
MIDKLAYSDYQKFEEDLRHKNRFFVNSKFVDSLKESIMLNTGKLVKGTILFRARIHEVKDPKDVPFSAKDMFNPRPEDAKRGRANPDGISYLYLSSDVETCIKEVAPRYNDVITVGEFHLHRDINLIDLTKSFPIHPSNYITTLNHCLRLAFSQSPPATRPEIEYLPYQFICELIKNENNDGVLYISCYDKEILTNSYNIVLFDSSLAELDSSKCNLINIESVTYNYEKSN